MEVSTQALLAFVLVTGIGAAALLSTYSPTLAGLMLGLLVLVVIVVEGSADGDSDTDPDGEPEYGSTPRSPRDRSSRPTANCSGCGEPIEPHRDRCEDCAVVGSTRK